MSLQDAFVRYLPLVEAELRQIVQVPHHSLAAYYGMMHYHLSWVDAVLDPVEARGGKRIRPLTCLLCATCSGNISKCSNPICKRSSRPGTIL